MRQADSDPARNRGLTRRQYVQILAGASAASIAGCTGDDDGGGDGDGGDGDGGGDVASDTLRLHIDNVPSQANMNIWAPNDRTQGQLVMTELTGPRDFVDNSKYLNGHTWDSPWIDDHDEISIPTVFDDFEIEPPYDTYEYLRGHEDGQDPLTFWDGTNIDAETFVQSWQVDWHNNDDHLNEEATFNYEADSEFVFHRWENKGEVEGQDDNPLNEAVLADAAAPTHEFANIMHPDFTGDFAERYQDATTEDDTQPIHDDLESTRVSFQDYAENDYGSGLYEVQPDTVSAQDLTLSMVDDHPNEHATVENIQIKFANGDRRASLASYGELDIGEPHVPEEGGDINRQLLPDHVQELARYIVQNGDHFAMNWNNPHLQRLWVRRAIITAIDWYDLTANGWGADGSQPSTYGVCAPDSTAESYMPQEFLDSLHSYTLEQDLDTAANYLERAGYTGGMDSGWTGPDGREFTLTLDQNAGIPDWTGAHVTMEAHLNEVGIQASNEPVEQSVFLNRHGQGEPSNITYGAGVMWSPSGPIWNWYEANGANYTFPIVGGDPGSDDAASADADDLQSDVDNHGRPFVQQVPTEAGAFEAPDQAGRAPNPSVDTEEVNLVAATEALQHPDTTQEEFDERLQQLARYANYYMPYFTFHSLNFGVWGNVRDFDWPDSEHGALRAEKEYDNVHYNYGAGIVQTSEDTDYESP